MHHDTTLTFGMSITEGSLTHVTQSYCPLARRIDEMVAFFWVELTGSNDFGQFFHIGWFNVDNVKGLVCNFHMPQIDPEIINRFLFCDFAHWKRGCIVCRYWCILYVTAFIKMLRNPNSPQCVPDLKATKLKSDQIVHKMLLCQN